MISVRVQQEDFDPGTELGRLEDLGGGALTSFVGLVRGDGGLVEMELEHYPAMTLKALEGIVAEAVHRWPLLGVGVIHRYGKLKVGDRIVFVGVTSPRRAAALEACAFLIDWLKTGAPFWKRERYANGDSRWVEARMDDETAAARWGAG